MKSLVSERLRHRITIQTVTITNDVEVWSNYATNVPADISYATNNASWGREYWEAQKVNAEARAFITIRYRQGILPTMRILSGGNIYRIIAPPRDPNGRRREISILAEDVTDFER